MIEQMIAEPAMLILLIGIVIRTYGFGLFIWWWQKNNWNASAVFIYVTMLFFASGQRDIIELYATWNRIVLCLPQEALKAGIYDQWWWAGRVVLSNLFYLIIAAHMSYRAFWQRQRM